MECRDGWPVVPTPTRRARALLARLVGQTSAEAGAAWYARAREESPAQAGPGAAHTDLLLVRHERAARAREGTRGRLETVGARYGADTGTAPRDPPTAHEG